MTRWTALAVLGGVGVLVVSGLLIGSRLLAPAPAAPGSVSWVLAQGSGPGTIVVMPRDHWRLDPTTSQDAMVIPIGVYWPSRYRWTDDSWLAAPEISYTPTSVTITLHQSPTFDPCDPGSSPCTVGGSLEPVYYEVRLSEPLMGRDLFDGSGEPPQMRPYP